MALDNVLLWIIMVITSCDNHYYDEDDIKVGEKINAHVVVNHVVELTEEEKEQARKNAIQKLQDEAYNNMKQPVRKAQTITINQPSLFDF